MSPRASAIDAPVAQVKLSRSETLGNSFVVADESTFTVHIPPVL